MPSQRPQAEKMALEDPLLKSAGNSALVSEVPEKWSPLPPPSPTGYEHCFLTRRNVDDDSESTQFAIQVVSYLPTGPQTLPLDVSDVSVLTRAQRDVLHYILEDRNSRTEDDGLWVLVGLLGAGAIANEERSEDFEISIMFCEYGASVDPHFDHSKRFYLSMTLNGGGGKRRAQNPPESEEYWEMEQNTVIGTKMNNKGKHVIGRGYADRSQGWNYSAAAPDKGISPGFPENSKTKRTILSQAKDHGLGVGDVPAKNSGSGSHFSADLKELFRDSYDSATVPKSFPSSNTHQMNGTTAEPFASSSSFATTQAAGLRWETSSAISENHAAPSVCSESKEQNSSKGSEETQTERLPTLTSTQLGHVHDWACKLRKERVFPQAVSLFRIVWYCREVLIGPFHTKTLYTMQKLASAYAANNQNDMAARLREMLKMRIPKSSPVVSAPLPTVSELFNLHQWALELRRQGAFKQAIWLFTIVWYARDILAGECHGSTLAVINQLALVYDDNGQPDMANRLRDELAERRQRKKSQDTL